jgi:hypothetical protein
MRVLIIPEDPTLDQHVVKPIVERIFADLGKPARVEVLKDPHVSGAAQALCSTLIAEVVLDNAMVDLILLVVDRDCDRQSHEAKARDREKEHQTKLIATLAWQEVEVWALAPHRAELDAKWPAVRAHCDPKEAYFDPFVLRKGWLETVGKGRKRAMRDLGSSWRGLLDLCPEIDGLKQRIQQWLQDRQEGAAQ